MRHPFYGNVRELRNVIERAIALDTDPTDMLGPALGLPQGLSELMAQHAPASTPASTAFAPPPPTPTAPLIARAPAGPSKVPAAVDLGPLLHGTQVTLTADCDLPFKEAKEKLLDAFEAAYIARLLTTGDNVSAIARAAGIDRKHLYTLMKKHQLDLRGKVADEGDE
jgi:DNA-binding NtrC family response regulator